MQAPDAPRGFDRRWTAPIILGVVCLASLVAFGCYRWFQWEQERQRLFDARQRLEAHLNEGRPYRVMVGHPLSRPVEWREARQDAQHRLHFSDGSPCALDDISCFYVCYPNGSLLDSYSPKLRLPATPSFAASAIDPPPLLSLASITEGNGFVQVTYAPSRSHPDAPEHYATTLKNVSDERIRVLWFAGYQAEGKQWRLATRTGKAFTAGEFRDWYGLDANEWLEPGAAACDANNYGGPPSLWVYQCETESGRQFLAGGVKY